MDQMHLVRSYDPSSKFTSTKLNARAELEMHFGRYLPFSPARTAKCPWGGGGGITPLYGQYEYVPWDREGFLRFSILS